MGRGAWLPAAVCFGLALSGCGNREAVDSSFFAADRAALPDADREAGPEARAVTLEPAGTWQVSEVPERIVAYQTIEAEIVLALGLGHRLAGMFNRDALETLNERYYRQLPGFEVPLHGIENLPFSDRVDKEVFYRLGPDVNLVDPRLPLISWGWDAEDVGEVARRTGPFFGNFTRFPRNESWGPAYRAYSLDELFAAYAKLFDREARYRNFAAFRDGVVAGIRDRLPSENQRPRVCVIGISSQPDKGRFYLTNVETGGVQTRQYRQLGVPVATLSEGRMLGEHGLCDYETLAELDPEVILVMWATGMCESPEEFHERFVAPMEAHPVGRRITAVREGRVLPGGLGSQGPISALFQLEMAAVQLFPEVFGAWSWKEGVSEPLFRRDELASVLRDAP